MCLIRSVLQLQTNKKKSSKMAESSMFRERAGQVSVAAARAGPLITTVRAATLSLTAANNRAEQRGPDSRSGLPKKAGDNCNPYRR